MLVKTLNGEYGRCHPVFKGGLRVAVTMLDENLFTKYDKGKPVIQYFKPYELIYRPEIIVKL